MGAPVYLNSTQYLTIVGCNDWLTVRLLNGIVVTNVKQAYSEAISGWEKAAADPAANSDTNTQTFSFLSRIHRHSLTKTISLLYLSLISLPRQLAELSQSILHSHLRWLITSTYRHCWNHALLKSWSSCTLTYFRADHIILHYTHSHTFITLSCISQNFRHNTSNVTSVTEVRSASARLFAGTWRPLASCHYNTLLCCNYFSSSSVVSRAFSALCMCSKFGHHPHPL